ncbi:type IV pilus assembly PilZ [Denitrovibrio acetiphilus DSM 12809]|uniref:Type IV pilus assembly PilZ n=1 Tax=Denitrovibrio acetiphilus (strain DSM 12809 / NBRC 114555 / N2460) TaxID=522772 RepID=D4H7G2_DENA2|nr:PilZ domain-containing protein [Denitrovibrio acetiphilus]ADD67961.1 type IV pilus assembly PilZ [Denitrovibrio acetiphilus DSM 12809]
MPVQLEERRQFKRYSAVPIKIYLKRDGEFRFTEMLDISLGGLQVRTNIDFNIYENYECQVEIPLKDGKDIIYAKAMVWRIEPDESNMKLGKRFVAFRFIEIHEYDKVVIAEFLSSFDEDVPYT